MRTSPQKLEKIAIENNVRLSRQKEQGRIVYGLHGFLSDIQATIRDINGYWIEHADTGYYLYRDDLLWD